MLDLTQQNRTPLLPKTTVYSQDWLLNMIQVESELCSNGENMIALPFGRRPIQDRDETTGFLHDNCKTHRTAMNLTYALMVVNLITGTYPPHKPVRGSPFNSHQWYPMQVRVVERATEETGCVHGRVKLIYIYITIFILINTTSSRLFENNPPTPSSTKEKPLRVI